MRITVSQYAKSLYGATEGKTREEVDLAVVNLFKILEKNRQMKLAKKIIEKFSDIWNRENGVVEAEVITGRKIEDQQVRQIEKFIQKKYSAGKVILYQKIDKEIKGGMILKVGDELLDASVAKRLDDLRSNLVK